LNAIIYLFVFWDTWDRWDGWDGWDE